MDFMKKLYRRELVLLRHYYGCKSKSDMTVKRNTADRHSKKMYKQNSEIMEHYSGSGFFQSNLEYINLKYLQRRKLIPDKMFAVDELVAKNIVTVIKSDLVKTSEPVFEANPGLGLITKELLKIDGQDLPKICLFENDPLFKKKMLELCGEPNDKRLKFYNTNILELWKINFLDKVDSGGGRLKGIMEDVQVKDWEETPSVKIIGALPNFSFIRSVISSIVFGYGITTYGRLELYILVSPSVYSSMRKPNRGAEALFSMFFTWRCLMEVDQKAFLPWTTQKPKTLKKLSNSGLDPTKLYLVKAVPKQDLYKTISPELMKPLWYFSKIVIRGNKQRVLPNLEKWIPGCGPRLISKGIGAFTQFSDLTTDEVLQVFLDFVNWPEFSSCPFLASMEDYLMKTETEDVSDTTADDGSEFSPEENIVILDGLKDV